MSMLQVKNEKDFSRELVLGCLGVCCCCLLLLLNHKAGFEFFLSGEGKVQVASNEPVIHLTMSQTFNPDNPKHGAQFTFSSFL